MHTPHYSSPNNVQRLKWSGDEKNEAQTEKKTKSRAKRKGRRRRISRRSKTLLQTYSILHLTKFNVNAQPLNDFVHELTHSLARALKYVCMSVFMYVR